MLNKIRTSKNQKGFTLIELMIVIAIIGILAAVAIPNYIAFKNKAYCTATVNDAKAVASALADYFAIPSNVTVTVPAATVGAAGTRPFITVGSNVAGAASNTLLLSASTTLVTVSQPSIAAGDPSYLISVTEGAGNCPAKVTEADAHWTRAGGSVGYVMTL